MNCEEVRDELELGFGTGVISDLAAEHLKQCEACRAYQTELEQLVPSCRQPSGWIKKLS